MIGLASTSLLVGWQAQAGVTPQGWWHYGEVADYYADSSGNNRRFAAGFSCAGGGNAGAGIVPIGAGGPLGKTGWTSTSALYWTPLHCNAAAMWNPWTSGAAEAEWNPPPTNYIVECWILPEGTGVSTGSRTWFFASGSGDFSQPSRPSRTGAGGVYFAVDNSSGAPQIGAFVIANAAQGVPADVQIGDFVDADLTSWMHVAIVNQDGVNSFYVNGVKKGASTTSNTIPNGNIFAGGSPGTTPSFRGYLDELRISTFAPGEFSVSDLLLRPTGPSIIAQPQPATVWAGGAAAFTVTIALDSTVTFQWRRGGVDIAGETKSTLYLPNVSATDNNASFDCVLKSGGITVTTPAVALTVVTPSTSDLSNANAYRNAVRAEGSLVAYFPADNCTDTVVTNVIDATHNGTLELGAAFDGQTNRALIQRALTFNVDGDVQIPSNPAYEFATGNGSVEALVYLNHTTTQDQTLFSVATDDTSYCYAIQVNGAGNTLTYRNGTDVLTWPIAPSLVGRRTHLAFVFDHAVNVTPYVNGQPLETKTQGAFGPGGSAAWIGSLGYSVAGWAGTIGELAIYSSALPSSAVQGHYTKYVYGTNVAAPAIVSQTVGPKTLMAGSAPVLSAVVSGALPLSYQWKSNNVAIAGATSATLTVAGGAAGTSATYILSVGNVFGTVESQPIELSFVAPVGKYAEIVSQDRPSSYWRLGEASGGVAADISGFNNANYGGAFTQGVTGAFGSDPDTAVQFRGGNAAAPYSSTLNPAGPFTIEFWAKPDQSGQLSRCVIGSQNRAVGRSGYAIYQGLNGAFWECHIGDGTTVQIWLFGKTYPEAGKWYHVAVVYSGAEGGRIYVNGADDTDTGSSTLTGNYLPNSAAAFEIASRFGGGVPYPGTVDDVAFYNYALTPAQILNHFKIQWYASQIVTPPAPAASVEGNTITLTAQTIGLPNTYQWFKNGVALEASNNADGTAHYPQGVTGTTLVISQALPSDAGQYHLVVSNPLGGSTSAAVAVSVAPDLTLPEVTSVTALGTPSPTTGKPYLVRVDFSKRMDSTTAKAIGNYLLNGGASLTGVTMHETATGLVLGGDWRSVILATSGLTPGQKYTLTVSGLKDRTVTGNQMTSKAVSFLAPVLTAGMAGWDYYYLGAPPEGTPMDVAYLNSSAVYPVAPMTNALPTSFDTGTLFTGNDLNNLLGALGDNYGDSLSGWVTPKVSGNYTFFLSSDDASELYLSSDDSPANLTLIATESTCCHAFAEPGVETTSGPIPLIQGHQYFIRALHTEGGGGDYVKVAWRIEGDETAAATLSPIKGEFLSAYAPVPAAKFNAPVMVGQNLQISWTGSGTLYESTDLRNWSPISNPGNPYLVTPTGPQKFYRIEQ